MRPPRRCDMGQRRRFTPEFKRQAVDLLNAVRRPRSLGNSASHAIISINGKSKWRRIAGRSPALGGNPNRQPKSRASNES